MFLSVLTLITALIISGVAVYYSVSGLAAIFSAAAVPIVIMGASLEIGKLVTALWLHKNWYTAPKLLRAYLMIATVVLMLITSMGIFGFLSRAHIEQTSGIQTVSTQIEQINLEINLETTRLDANRRIMAQLDDAVENLLRGVAIQSTQTRVNNAQTASNLATQATRLRNQQAPERNRLQQEIEQSNSRIADFNRQKLVLEQQIRFIETEVGPIKYIAQFVYGEQPNQDLLEKAVTWMIIIIIFVFDPLAVLLLIASQIGFSQLYNNKKIKKEAVEPIISTKPENVYEKENQISTIDNTILETKKELSNPNENISNLINQENVTEELSQDKKKDQYIMKSGNQQLVKQKNQ
jgi:hypothetical protein